MMLRFLTREAQYTGDNVVAFLKEVESFPKDNVNTVSYGAYLLKQFDVFREINEHERVIGDIAHNYFLPLKK